MTGIAAALSLVLPHPAVAAAFTRLVDDLLPDRHTRWQPPDHPWGTVTDY